MILEALHTTLNPVLDAYPLIGDIEAEPPFCVFAAEPTPIRDKTGITEYEYRVRVKVVSFSAAETNEKTTGVMAVLDTISGTINGTVFNEVQFTDESGVYYNPSPEGDAFMNDIQYRMWTQNR